MAQKTFILFIHTVLFACCAFSQGTAKPTTASAQKTDVLRQLSNSFEEISQHSGQAVVQIFSRSYVKSEESENSGELLTAQNSTGSGFILSPDGYILTNGHVVRGAHQVRVRLNIPRRDETRERRRELKGTVLGVDHETDLAVIKIDRNDLPYLAFGNSDRLQQGQLVLALGNPLGLEHSVSFGIVSAVARQLKPDDAMAYIQTDAPINPGNSGGPLMDSDGHVVGINTFILTQSGGSEGIGFAIPSSIAEQVYLQLKTQGRVHRSKLGLVGETINLQMSDGLDLPTDHGVIVSDLEPHGSAETAGLERDDIVVALDGKRVDGIRQLEGYVHPQPAGRSVILHVKRGANEIDIPVVTVSEADEIGSLADSVDPQRNQVQQLGIIGVDITKEVLQLMPDLDRPAGVLVAARNANVAYSGPLLQVGDAIYEANRRVVSGVVELKKVLDAFKSGEAVVLLVERGGHLIYVPLELEDDR